ncbi:unnamed protein product [Clonostachys rosea]|uniref:Uncharacterized protein n=1 Tax=Bionectria ochroleuca TaxID=29856 RepID=A0ABY6UDM8_BIOOC|nr:unnamed protein product [Clonostachys rosea]
MHLVKIISLFTLFFTLAAAQYAYEYDDEAALERREMLEGFREEYRAARDLEPRGSGWIKNAYITVFTARTDAVSTASPLNAAATNPRRVRSARARDKCWTADHGSAISAVTGCLMSIYGY